MAEQLIGTVTHFFPQPSVAIVQLTDGELQVGDQVHFMGHTTDFVEKITSMEVEHAKVQRAGPGDEVGVLVTARVRPHDKVYKVVP
jgi:translation elongation factor EF-1alpha